MSALCPQLLLRRPLGVGWRVRVKAACHQGKRGTVEARLTTTAEPAFLMGCARYAVRMDDRRLADYAGHELAVVPRERRRA